MLNANKTNENFDAGSYHAPPIEPPLSSLTGLCEIELVFSPRVAFRVYDEFDEGVINRADDGSLRVFALMPEDDWLYSFLLSLGKDVEVLRPLHIKEKLLRMHHIP
jgi:predicted DNA-binding transcriptional regulator YafY